MSRRRVEDVLLYLPEGIRNRVGKVVIDGWTEIEEIRLRADGPLTLGVQGESCFLTSSGGITNYENNAYCVTADEVRSAFSAICENSVYAYMDEIRQGFVTIKGGHRVGICGKAVAEDGRIKTFREVSSLNFRIAREVIGVADGIMDYIVKGSEVESTLIVSPPQTGKTTLIRDVMRQVSDRGFKTCVADDRGELSAMYGGVPQNRVGAQTDIIDSAPKAEAILMMVRTMSPRVIVSDEIACGEDVKAICMAFGTGVSIIATTHGSSVEEVMKRRLLKPLFNDGVFKKIILMSRRFSAMESIIYTKVVEL